VRFADCTQPDGWHLDPSAAAEHAVWAVGKLVEWFGSANVFILGKMGYQNARFAAQWLLETLDLERRASFCKHNLRFVHAVQGERGIGVAAGNLRLTSYVNDREDCLREVYQRCRGRICAANGQLFHFERSSAVPPSSPRPLCVTPVAGWTDLLYRVRAGSRYVYDPRPLLAPAAEVEAQVPVEVEPAGDGCAVGPFATPCAAAPEFDQIWSDALCAIRAISDKPCDCGLVLYRVDAPPLLLHCGRCAQLLEGLMFCCLSCKRCACRACVCEETLPQRDDVCPTRLPAVPTALFTPPVSSDSLGYRYCNVCSKWASEDHLASDKHLRKLAWFQQQVVPPGGRVAPAPPPGGPPIGLSSAAREVVPPSPAADVPLLAHAVPVVHNLHESSAGGDEPSLVSVHAPSGGCASVIACAIRVLACRAKAHLLVDVTALLSQEQ